jgi:hypothetical protein
MKNIPCQNGIFFPILAMEEKELKENSPFENVLFSSSVKEYSCHKWERQNMCGITLMEYTLLILKKSYPAYMVNQIISETPATQRTTL